MKSIKQTYDERKSKPKFELIWDHTRRLQPTNLDNFSAQAHEFMQEFQADEEVSELLYTFRMLKFCPFQVIESKFSDFILLFSAVKKIVFFSCHFNDENFKDLEKLKTIQLNSLEFWGCNIPEAKNYFQFLKIVNMKHLKLFKNKNSSRFYSSLFKNISFSTSLKRLHIDEREGEYSMIILAIRKFLRANKTINILDANFQFQTVLGEDILELNNIVESHPSIISFNIRPVLIEANHNSKMLKKLVRSSLQKQYQERRKLNEFPVFLMGDGRTGKTSLLRNLSGKKFEQEVESTLVLEDTQIFEVDSKSKFKPLTKYELSVQRAQNMIHCEYEVEDEVKKSSIYNLDFEEELITRAISDAKFVKGFTTKFFADFISTNTFLRVYDFGGQEVFSSVHPIFMNPKGLYIIVFNLTKLKEDDLFRLKFWYASIKRNAPKSPVLFIGTFLNTFLKKNNEIELEKVNETLKNIISAVTRQPAPSKPNTRVFVPIDNAVRSNNKYINKVRKLIQQFHLQKAYNFLRPSMWIKSVYVLFLDNCREESSYMTVQEFKLKAQKCNFSEGEVFEMLEIYLEAGIISYFKELDLPENKNFIFFAPAFLAQAVGSFIRDESFHQLAFRTNEYVFSDYRKYVDTGIIRKDLFVILLKQYSQREREYVLSLALHNLILFVHPKEKNSFIVPELLPDVNDSKIEFDLRPDYLVKTENIISIQSFLQISNVFFKEPNLQQSLLYTFFARFIFSPEEIIDVFLVKDRELGIRFIGSKKNAFLLTLVRQLVGEINKCEEEVDEVFRLETRKPRFRKIRWFFNKMKNLGRNKRS
eukprot:snap_masked-scaffold_16-processed-gene-1.30-mRNA-1 protein AED:1.00 eAED:1.00 QI:0/0/0/0/1/1/9/0/814